jgi:hypothetical protein
MAAFSCVSDYFGALTCCSSQPRFYIGSRHRLDRKRHSVSMDPFTCQKSSRPAFLEASRLSLVRAEASGWHRSSSRRVERAGRSKEGTHFAAAAAETATLREGAVACQRFGCLVSCRCTHRVFTLLCSHCRTVSLTTVLALTPAHITHHSPVTSRTPTPPRLYFLHIARLRNTRGSCTS